MSRQPSFVKYQFRTNQISDTAHIVVSDKDEHARFTRWCDVNTFFGKGHAIMTCISDLGSEHFLPLLVVRMEKSGAIGLDAGKQGGLHLSNRLLKRPHESRTVLVHHKDEWISIHKRTKYGSHDLPSRLAGLRQRVCQIELLLVQVVHLQVGETVVPVVVAEMLQA